MQIFSPSPCLFAEPEAVSKNSVSLWIGYSDTCSKRNWHFYVFIAPFRFPARSFEILVGIELIYFTVPGLTNDH